MLQVVLHLMREVSTDPEALSAMEEMVRAMRVAEQSAALPQVEVPAPDVNLILHAIAMRATKLREEMQAAGRDPLPLSADIFLALLDELLASPAMPKMSPEDMERLKLARAQAMVWGNRWDLTFSEFPLSPEFEQRLKRRVRLRVIRKLAEEASALAND
jgi:hypothetical protein